MAKDPTEITGSWDVVFALPTNSTAEELSTGTGEAWSHPFSSNLVNHGWFEDGGYLGKQWATAFNGTTTEIDHGSDANLDDLHDAAFTAEAWIRADSWGESDIGLIIGKEKWQLMIRPLSASLAGLYGTVICADTTAHASSGTDEFPVPDGKWCHVAMFFDDAGDRKIYLAIDGVWVSSYVVQIAGSGAITTDASDDLTVGNNSAGTMTFDGAIGWYRISDNDRYTAGTDFVPARTPPASDGNTILLVHMDEGTGATVDNEQGDANRDGTISNGTWEQQWTWEGSPVVPTSVEFDGSATSVNCGSDAGLDDLADNAFTAEAWVRADGKGEGNLGRIFDKTGSASKGWVFYISGASGIAGAVYCATTDATAGTGSDDWTPDGKWHHVAFFFDDAGDRKIHIAIDGVWTTSYASAQIAGDGAIVSDAAENLFIGNSSDSSRTFDGGIGWCQISNNDRYDAATPTNFTPTPRTAPPASDGNTLALWYFDEGSGTALDNEEGTAARDGTITSGTWNNTPDMSVDAPGQRIYNWGYVLGSDAANEGVYQDYVCSAGDDFVIRVVVESDGLVSQPKVILYDQSNTAEIGSITGSAAEALGDTDYLFTGEAPAGCTQLRVKVINAAATGELFIHQCELLANLITNPSMETGAGDPWIPTGWSNLGLDAGDTEASSGGGAIVHSGSDCIQFNSGAASSEYAGITSLSTSAGIFYGFDCFVYGDGSKVVNIGPNNTSSVKLQTGASSIITEIKSAAWNRIGRVLRVVSSPTYPWISFNAVNPGYIDDVSMIALTAVSLTATAASEANSQE